MCGLRWLRVGELGQFWGLRGLLVGKLGLNCGVEGVRDLETRAELWVQGLCNWQLGLNYAVEGVTVWLGLSRGCRRG